LKSYEDSYRLSLLDTVTFLGMAWNSVKQEIVANCFMKAEFIGNAVAKREGGSSGGDGGDRRPLGGGGGGGGSGSGGSDSRGGVSYDVWSDWVK
jgi:hypothetical protein